jgi:replicative DNA helicase
MKASGLRLGIDQLDLVFHPGMLPGQVMVILAKTGTGKTIFLLNLFQRMASIKEDIRILFISLEQTAAEWYERARRIHRFYNLDADDGDTLDYWREKLLIVDKNRLRADTYVGLLKEFTYEMGRKPDAVAIDYLGYWAQAFPGERYTRTSDAVMAMKEIGKDEGIFTAAPHQVSRGTSPGSKPTLDAARDAGVVEETADFLLTLWNPDTQYAKNPKEKKGIVHCAVEKSRHGGVGAVQDFRFAPLTLAMVPIGEEEDTLFTQRAKRELEYADPSLKPRLSWEDAIYKHQLGSPAVTI